MIKVTIEKTFNKTPEDAMKCLCALACIEGAILSTAQIIERLGEGGSKTIHIQIEGKARMVFDQIQEALLGNDDFDFRCAETPLFDKARGLQVSDRVRIGVPLNGDSDIYEGREGVVLSIADEVDVRFDLGYAELSGLFPIERLEVIPLHELQVGDVVRWVMATLTDNARETHYGVLEGIDESNALVNGEAQNPHTLTYIRPSRLCIGDRIWVEEEATEECNITFMDHDIIGFNRSEDGTELVIADLGDLLYSIEVPMSRCSLDLEALAIRVAEQEDQMAEEEEA